MRTVLTWIMLLLLAALTAPAQTSHRQMPTPTDASSNPPVPPAAKQVPVDMVQFQKDADELAQLAQSIPPDVGKVQKGVLPKDLDERLKRIEKLSKKLRGQLQWF